MIAIFAMCLPIIRQVFSPPVAELGRGLRAHPQPLVSGEGGAGAVRVHPVHRELNVLHLAARGHRGDLDEGVQRNLAIKISAD